MRAADIPSLHDLISFQDFEKATSEWAKNGEYRSVNPKSLDVQHLESTKCGIIKQELEERR